MTANTDAKSPIVFEGNVASQLWDWLTVHVFTFDMAVESGLVLLCLCVGYLVYRPIHLRVSPMGSQTYRWPVLSILVKMLDRLLYPLIGIVLLFIADQISTSVGYDAGLCRVVIKLLMAWIVIGLVTRVIKHDFARNLAALVIWFIAALSIFGVLGQVSQTLGETGFTLGEFHITALGVIKGILVLSALLYASMALSMLVDKRLAYTKLNPASRMLIGKTTRILLVTCALLIAITTAGIDLSVLAVFSGAIGLGIGFGLQRGFSNMFSGMMLLMDQSIKPGDVIEVPDPSGKESTFGWVTHMGGRYTEIVTRDNRSFLIPNEHLITQQVVNWSHGDTLVRLKVSFGVNYKSDPHHVKRVAQEAAARVDRVEKDPKPACHLTEFADSSINFSLRFWIRDAEKGVTNVKGDVLLALWDAFKAEGIDIPYPHREVFIHTVKED